MSRAENSKIARDGICVGIAIVLLSIVVAWQTSLIPSEAAYARVGPDVAPWLVAAMLAILGIAIMVEAWLGRWRVGEAQGEFDRAALLWVMLGLFLNVTTITYLGFILASTLLFLCAARAFGSRSLLRDGAIGFVIATVAYVGFDRGLGYEIGDGLIENLL